MANSLSFRIGLAGIPCIGPRPSRLQRFAAHCEVTVGTATPVQVPPVDLRLVVHPGGSWQLAKFKSMCMVSRSSS